LASSDQIAKPRAKAVIVNAARAQRRNRQVNIDSGYASFQFDIRYSGCRRTLDDLLSIHSLKQAATQPAHDRVENNSAKRAGAYHHGHKY
jgi:hypothetical protein